MMNRICPAAAFTITFLLLSVGSRAQCPHGGIPTGKYCTGPTLCALGFKGNPGARNPLCVPIPGCQPLPGQGSSVCFGIPIDPNDKTGPFGVGQARYLPANQPLPYEIHFENLAAATAAAQQVIVTDQLNAQTMDVTTFSFGPIWFGASTVVPPPGLSQYTTNVDLRPAQNLIVRIDAALDKTTALLTWRFTSIDPATLQLTQDAAAGFLPPNVSPPAGEGGVVFNVNQKVGLASGAQIQNQANVVFDKNAPIATPVWMNTLDVTPPVTSMQALPATESSTTFTVQWSGSDAGSGIQDYTVYVSKDGGSFSPFATATTSTSAAFTGVAGSTYAFYSVGRDFVGNVESKTVADTTTRIISSGGDSTPPVTTAGQSPLPNSAGWNNTNVTVTLNATDNPGGSGVKQIQYSTSGAQVTALQTVSGNTAAITITAAGSTTVTYFATDNAGNQEPAKTLLIKIDKTPPVVSEFRLMFGSQTYNLIGSTRNRLPWQITGVQVVFSKPIAVGNTASAGGLAATALSGLGTSTLTWTINPLSVGDFAAALAGTGANALLDVAGNRLAGGLGFTQKFRLLFGDFNDDGAVSSADLVGVNAAIAAPYSIFADINGDGVVNLADVASVRTGIGTTLP
jgi:hypothetical protein